MIPSPLILTLDPFLVNDNTTGPLTVKGRIGFIIHGYDSTLLIINSEIEFSVTGTHSNQNQDHHVKLTGTTQHCLIELQPPSQPVLYQATHVEIDADFGVGKHWRTYIINNKG